MSLPYVVCLSVTMLLLHSRKRLDLFGNIFASPNSSGHGEFVSKFWAKSRRGCRGSCKLNTRGYEKLAFFDQYIALFRKRYKIRP